MFRKRRADVLVVGAGPVGMMTGLRLVQRGARVLIVDETSRTKLESYALALHPSSLALLDEAGLASELLETGFRIDRISFLDGSDDRPKLTLDFSRLPGKFPFVLVLPQSTLESTLENHLRAHHVRVQWNHRAAAIREETDEVVTELARLDKAPAGIPVARSEWGIDKVLEARCAYVVGADGCRSFVRSHLGAEYRKLGEKKTYVVFEFDTPERLKNEVLVFLRDKMTSLMWPLSEHTCRWTLEIDDSDQYKTNGPGGSFVLGSDVKGYLNDELHRRAPWFPPAEGRIHWSPLVQFDRRLAETFGKGRTWLAGDAAHVTSPIGVQSLNGGLVEAWDLAGLLAAHVVDDGGPLPLEEYGERRLREWRRLLGMDSFIRIGSSADEWVRAHAGSILSSVPATGEDLLLLLGQAGLERGPVGDTSLDTM